MAARMMSTWFSSGGQALHASVCNLSRCLFPKDAAGKRITFLTNSLHEILHILSLTLFETTQINQRLTPHTPDQTSKPEPQQLARV
jgi:hypothetical protein